MLHDARVTLLVHEEQHHYRFVCVSLHNVQRFSITR